MSPRHRSFTATRKASDYSPLSFELNGETFNVKPIVQGGYLLKFVSQADSDSGGEASGALFRFFDDVMEPPERIRFQTMLDDPDTIIDIELIGEIVAYLMEEYTARPTVGRENSSTGQSISGPSSTENAS